MSYKILSVDLLSKGGLNCEFVAKFALFLALILLVTILCGKALRLLFKLPIVAGQIIGGIILGPSLFNIQKLKFFQEPLKFLDSTQKYLCSIASTDLFVFFILLLSSAITVSYLLWLAGHETDVQDMAKVGFESTISGVLAAIAPIAMITATAYYLFGQYYSLASSIGQGMVFAATSVSIPIAMLISYRKMHTRSAKVTMGAAIVDDVLAIVLFSLFMILLQSGFLGESYCSRGCGECTGIGKSLLRMFLSFVTMFVVGKLAIHPINKILKKFRMSHLIPPFAAIMMLFYFSVAELIGGLAGITGAYFAGLFHRSGDAKHKAVRAVSPFVNTILLPIFLGSIGMQVDIAVLKFSHWKTVLVFLMVAVFSKLLGCLVTTYFSNFFIKDKNEKWTFWESYTLGASMVARGEVGLVIATILNSTHLMSSTQYVICVATIILTTIVSPIMLLIGFNKLSKMEGQEFEITIGPFKNISIRHLFDVISSSLEFTEEAKPIIALSEGRKILTLSGNVKIILKPSKGILFRGNEEKIRKIIGTIKSSLSKDLDKIPELGFEEL